MGLIPVLLCGMLFISILHRAWVRRQAFELRMQVLEIAVLAIRRGQSLVPAFRKLAQEHGRVSGRRLTRMARELEQGEDLSEALQWSSAESFPPEVLSVVREAEGTAQIADVLESLLQQTDDKLGVQHRVALGLLYPMGLIMAVLFTQEIVLSTPGIRDFVEPGWFSVRDLVGWMPFGGRVSPWIVFCSAVLGTILCVHYAWRSVPVLRQLFAFLGSQLPLRSRGARYRVAGQFLTTLSHLIAGGQSLPAAMRRSIGAMGSPKMEAGIQRCAAAMEEGVPPNDAWRLSGLPEFAIASVTAATKSQPERLVDALRRTGQECRARYVTQRERWLDMMHPVCVVVFGAMLAINLQRVVLVSHYVAESTGLW